MVYMCGGREAQDGWDGEGELWVRGRLVHDQILLLKSTPKTYRTTVLQFDRYNAQAQQKCFGRFSSPRTQPPAYLWNLIPDILVRYILRAIMPPDLPILIPHPAPRRIVPPVLSHHISFFPLLSHMNEQLTSLHLSADLCASGYRPLDG